MKNERLNTLNGVLNSVASNLVTPFLVIFALKLGANNFQTALLSSGPAIAGLLVLIPGAKLVDKSRDRFQVTAILMAANRLFFLLMAAVPFLVPAQQASAFLLLVTIMNAPGAIANSAWQSTIAQVIPAERRPDAFAARNRAMNIFGTITALVAGLLLDWLPSPWGYQGVFAGAFFVALAEIRVYLRLKPIENAQGQPSSGPGRQTKAKPLTRVREALRELAENRTFVRYTAASVVFYFGWQTPWTIFSLYQVKELGASNFWISLLGLLNTGGTLIGYQFWVRRIQRHGNLYVLWLSAFPLVLVPLTYALSHSLVVIAVLTVFVGMTLSGLTVALFNSLLEATPEMSRTTYIAYYNTAITVTSVIAPLWGVLAYQWWGFQVAFFVCFGQRLLGIAALFLLWWRGRVSHPAYPAD